METFYPVLPGFHPLISGGSGENDFPGARWGVLKTPLMLAWTNEN